jgi:hypothetical protein
MAQPASDNLAAAAADRLQAADALYRAEVGLRTALQHRLDAAEAALRVEEALTPYVCSGYLNIPVNLVMKRKGRSGYIRSTAS